MTIYFAASTNSFYDTDIIDVSQMPEDKVAVSAADYQNLLTKQNAGEVIIAAADGSPTTMQQNCPACDCLVHERVTADSDTLGHIKPDNTTITTADDGTASVNLNNVQSKLTFDSTPTAGSTNPVTSEGIKTAIDAKDSLPAQSGNSGKYLTTDGTTASWGTVDISSKADDSNVVHKTGAETITGPKVFNGAYPIKLGKGGYTYTEVQLTSDGSTRTGGLRSVAISDEVEDVKIYMANNAGSIILGEIGIRRDASDGILTMCPAPAASTDKKNTAIMTVGRAADPSQNFNLLHRSGDEVFSGVKTCQTSAPRFGLRNTNIDLDTNPSEPQSSRIFFADKDGAWTSEIGCYQQTDGQIVTQITANNGSVSALQAICNKDGTKYATAPTPSDAADSSTKIATTAWVNSRITSVMNSKLVPDYSGGTSISSGYTAAANGIAYLTHFAGNTNTTSIQVNNIEVAQMCGHSGSSHGKPNPCATVILGKGQTITFSDCQTARFYLFN